MILYGSSLSPFARKVLAYAAEKGIELELQPTGFPNFSPEYLEASPFRKMPALRDGDYTGTRTVARSPPSGLSDSMMSPPCERAMSRAMASPSPVPPSS